jgi:hypothetical protein
MGKFQTIHIAWHSDIGKDDTYVGPALKDVPRLRRVARFHYVEAPFSASSAISIRRSGSSSTNNITGLMARVLSNAGFFGLACI